MKCDIYVSTPDFSNPRLKDTHYHYLSCHYCDRLLGTWVITRIFQYQLNNIIVVMLSNTLDTSQKLYSPGKHCKETCTTHDVT